MRVVIAQGGGPTAVINESLVAALRHARDLGADAVYGALNGIRGLAEDRLADLTGLTNPHLERLAATACAGLGSTRDKPDAGTLDRVVATLRRRGIGAIVSIGGNDTAGTLAQLADGARARGLALACVHVPKTIDNDLAESDVSPGWPSAARFVANAFAGIDLDMRAMPGVYVGVVMGRHAGWLTAASALWRRLPDDGPHLIYVPEQPFDAAAFVKDVAGITDRLGRCVVAVSEGVVGADGRPAIEALAQQAGTTLERDAHGNVQLTNSALAEALRTTLVDHGIAGRVRADTFGFVQRAYADCRSPVDVAIARAVGHAAVGLAWTGGSGAVTVTVGAGDESITTGVVPLDRVAGQTRLVPPTFLAPDRPDVTSAFLDYARPLVGAPPPLARLWVDAHGVAQID